MPDKRIFCNTPWYEVHIYWDGSLGICCQESHKLYGDQELYNIATTSIQEWFNSAPVRRMRQEIMGDSKLSSCSRCYIEETAGGNSRRYRSNMKSAIFTLQAFQDSYKQSPGFERFSYSENHDGHTDLMPIELHIDLGNFCNLACKMCNPRASSTIASHQVRWGIESSRQYLGTDWTRDETVWRKVLDELTSISNLKNIHFMGGETLLTDKMEQMVDHFIDQERFDCSFSFVTNGTVYPPGLMEKLSMFARTGIEVSIETLTEHNAYVRQGTDNHLVQQNIQKFNQWAAEHVNTSVTLRPAVGLLTVGYFDTLLEYARESGFVVKALACTHPRFLDPAILPDSVKQIYEDRLMAWAKTLPDLDHGQDSNASDPNNLMNILADQTNLALGLLRSPRPPDADDLLRQLVEHCARWDRVYDLDARVLYPELADVFERYDYEI